MGVYYRQGGLAADFYLDTMHPLLILAACAGLRAQSTFQRTIVYVSF